MGERTENAGPGAGEDVPQGGLTTGEVARRLGVAPTTVRTWDSRYGLGPDLHTGGRHRRWAPADVARLERMCALTATGVAPAEAARLARTEEPPGAAPARPARAAAPPRRAPARTRAGSGLSLGDARQECKGIARAALRLDATALERLLLDAMREHGLVAAWTEVIVPTLQAVGRKWESSGRGTSRSSTSCPGTSPARSAAAHRTRSPTARAPPRCSPACRGEPHPRP